MRSMVYVKIVEYTNNLPRLVRDYLGQKLPLKSANNQNVFRIKSCMNSVKQELKNMLHSEKGPFARY